jgi:hypothetical protein
VPVGVPVEAYGDLRGLAVLGDVGERLGDREVGHGLDRGRDHAEIAHIEVDRQAGAGRERGQRTGEPPVGEDRRVDRPDHLP